MCSKCIEEMLQLRLKHLSPTDLYTRTWLAIQCPCGTVNWVDNGNVDDLTIEDEQGFKCFNCGETHWFEEDLARRDEESIVLGVASPVSN